MHPHISSPCPPTSFSTGFPFDQRLFPRVYFCLLQFRCPSGSCCQARNSPSLLSWKYSCTALGLSVKRELDIRINSICNIDQAQPILYRNWSIHENDVITYNTTSVQEISVYAGPYHMNMYLRLRPGWKMSTIYIVSIDKTWQRKISPYEQNASL